MLTATQVETVAFVTDGGIICRDCAESRFGELGVAAIEEGIAEFLPRDVSPLIRYELDNIIGEDAHEWIAQEGEVWQNIDGDWYSRTNGETHGPFDSEDEAEQALYDEYPDEYACDDCGGGIS